MPLAKFERKTIVPAKEIRHACNTALSGPRTGSADRT